MRKATLQHFKFYEQLGANIRRYRKRRRLSQEALARLISLTRTSLTNIEKGRQHPPVHVLCEIVEHLKINIADLLPRISPREEPDDLRELARSKVRAEAELLFIESGIKGGPSHDYTEKQNSGTRR